MLVTRKLNEVANGQVWCHHIRREFSMLFKKDVQRKNRDSLAGEVLSNEVVISREPVSWSSFKEDWQRFKRAEKADRSSRDEG